MDNGGAFTARLLAEAGIEAGMRALDVGCGPGDVAFRVAEIVGPKGRVHGLDVDPAAIAKARERKTALGAANTSFEVGELMSTAELDPVWDAVTCRRVLMYLPDRLGALRAMARALRPGGLILIQEHDASVQASSTRMPLHEKTSRWVWDTVRAEGADPATGFALHGLLTAAGLEVTQVFAEAVVQTQRQAAPTAAIVRMMMPRIVAGGIATKAEIEPDTLEARLAEEREGTRGTFVGEMIFGAIARKVPS